MLKEYLLRMFAWFHQYCEENDIRYYMIEGTMLGAERHHGFIPWDDDIDVGVPRPDYDRLMRSFRKKDDERYVIESYLNGNVDFPYCYGKIYDTETTLIEAGRRPVKRGLFIDVFPLDGMGDTLEEASRRFRLINRRFQLIVAESVALRKGRSPLKNAAALAARLIPGGLSGRGEHIAALNDLLRAKNFEAARYGGNMLSTWREKEIMPISYYGTPKLYDFETIHVYGVENPDGYLTRLYGDWRKLPGVEQRVTRHEFTMCDLTKSYLK